MLQSRSVYATLPRTQRGMPLVLGGDPKGKTFLYPNGNSIIIRDIDNPAISDIYTEHSAPTTVAKYSPSGFYICSADQSGKVRIWDTTQQEHLLKNEYQPFAGTVKDLSWSADNQRIVAVGEGREKFAHVFMAETGTSVGEINGHSKIVNSCDFKPSRPFRIITGSEDNFVGIYEGPPFKFKHQLEDHTRFVQAVRFSPSGDFFATAGFDGKMFLYNSKDYSKVGEFGSPAHGGGIYAIAWSPDGNRILSCSGDKSCKLWDVTNLSLVSEFIMGTDILDQQVSCLWQGNNILSVSLSGFINYLDEANPAKPRRIIKGHNKSITSLAVHADPGSNHNTIYTGSHDGCVTYWDAETGDNDRVSGKSHTNQVQDMAHDSTSIYTAGYDDTIKAIDLKSNEYTSQLKMDSQPKGLAVLKAGATIVVAGFSDVSVVSASGQKLSSLPVDFEPSCVAVHPSDGNVAVGGTQSHKVHIFSTNGNNLSPKLELEHRDAITDVAYSSDGKYLAASDANRKVVLYNASSNYELSHNLDWAFHAARVNCLAWAPDNVHLASGSLDTAIIIWNADKPDKHTALKKAHPQSQITRLAWLDGNTLVSTGHDANVKVWNVTF
ncbi:Actin-interacting protein 1 [Halotydeus destructor]|nr:Actin-interacting protein 1 [Halotydeus destructor]